MTRMLMCVNPSVFLCDKFSPDCPDSLLVLFRISHVHLFLFLFLRLIICEKETSISPVCNCVDYCH